ncbi:MAG: hypothetical protein KGL38_13380, partial [Gemmatimonadota bacterium]|nr:hypothetical protein [Gemmatimonadota bacterium]
MSESPTADSLTALVDRLSHGDRSTALVVHALLSVADDRGAAAFDRVAVAYRDDHLAALRASGHDAEREAGRLSLDEVRAYLAASLLPRLAGEGLLVLPPSGLKEPDARIRFADAAWRDVAAHRAELTAAMRRTGEQPVATGEFPGVAPEPHVVPGGSRLEAEGLVKVYRRRPVVN